MNITGMLEGRPDHLAKANLKHKFQPQPTHEFPETLPELIKEQVCQ